MIDRQRLAAIREREDALFHSRTPRSRELVAEARRHLPCGVPMAWMAGLYRHPPLVARHGEGAVFEDADGNRYVDFNVCDLSMTMGFGQPAITAAVARAMSAGAHFLLPTEDAAVVARLLAERVGLPFWQFTLAASGANVEVIRIARLATGRRKILVFAGRYHGHIAETMALPDAGDGAVPVSGLLPEAGRDTVTVPFNDLAAVERALAGGEIALLLTEPALTNCATVLPEPGFLAGLRALTQRHGTLLALDEAHTHQFAYGGLVGAWSLECDFVILGKGLGTGVAFALYGMSAPIARLLERHLDVDIGPRGIALGGTLYGSAAAAAAARAALEEVLTRESYDRVVGLGRRLALGLKAVCRDLGLPWRAFHLGPRSGLCVTPELPRDAAESAASCEPLLVDTRRVYLANRGIWDAIVSAGPQASFAHGEADIDRYVSSVRSFLSEAAAAA